MQVLIQVVEVELVDIYFRPPRDNELGEFMPVARALQIVCAGISQKLNAVLIGRAFKELGFEQQRTKATRGYVVVERSAQEIKERLKDLAFQVTDDG